VGDPLLLLKFALKVTHLFKAQQFRSVSAHSASTVRAGKKVWLALVGSRPRAFQLATDEPCTLPVSPQRVAQNAILLFLPVKFNFCLKKSATKFLCVKNSSGTSYSYIIPLSISP